MYGVLAWAHQKILTIPDNANNFGERGGEGEAERKTGREIIKESKHTDRQTEKQRNR